VNVKEIIKNISDNELKNMIDYYNGLASKGKINNEQKATWNVYRAEWNHRTTCDQIYG
jgi:hypothetical protein